MKIKSAAYLLLAGFLAACSMLPPIGDDRTPPSGPSDLAEGSSATPTVDTRATLLATEPSMEVGFDGHTCTLDGPDRMTVGVHLFVFRNHSDSTAYFAPRRHAPGHSWDDAIEWVEANCGPPGSYCKEGPAWMAIPALDKSIYDGLDVRYQQYSMDREAEYSLWVETHDFLLWPCGPLNIVAD